jgi:hypothetical protein
MEAFIGAQERLLSPSGPALLAELMHELSNAGRAAYSKFGRSPAGMDQWFRCHNELAIMVSEQLLVVLGAWRSGYPTDSFINALQAKARSYGEGCEQHLIITMSRAMTRQQRLEAGVE